jgi:isopentenyl-diphosphate delta-isomerase
MSRLATVGTAAGIAVGAAVAYYAYNTWEKRKSSAVDEEAKALAEADALLESSDAEQKRLMEERVILLDEHDNVIGDGSKKDTHLNVNIDKGMLHRAFSVFMFNKAGKLMLQQRSDDKITFPAFWANTCCSHPLHTPEELEAKDYLGVKRAAVRKMGQELGIPAEQLPLDCFTFLTRVHYRAGSDGIWGEHEIDYILFCQPPEDVTVDPNPNEVQSTRWFSPEELREWVSTSDSRGDLVSPWFRIIEETLLHGWWQAKDEGRLEDVVDHATIHRAGNFDVGGSLAGGSAESGEVEERKEE